MNTPDIEIYIKNIKAEQILSWLSDTFSDVDITLKPNSLEEKHSISGTLYLGEQSVPVVITPWAAGKSFCSMWFKSSETPWENDEACAMSLLEKYDLEVRCATGGWEEDEDEAGEYWNIITRNEKKLIRWG